MTHYADRGLLPDGRHGVSIYAYPKYYRDGDPATGQLTPTDCAIVPSDYPGLSDWMMKRGVWSLYARNDGEYAVKHLGHALRFKLTALVLLKPDRTWEVIRTADEVAPEVLGDSITWRDRFPGVDQTIQAVPDQTRDVLTIRQEARDALRDWLLAHGFTTPQSLEGHYLAFAYEVAYRNFDDGSEFAFTQQLESGATFTNAEDVETQGRIYHLAGGRVKQLLGAGAFTQGDLSIPKLKRFATVAQGRYYLEGCRLTDIMAMPDGTVRSNATVSYQEGVSGYSGCIDTSMRLDDADTNFDGVDIRVGHNDNRWSFLISWDIPLSGVTVTNAYIDLVVNATAGTLSSINAYQVFKPWVEATATYNDWDGPNLEWHTGGCGNGDDLGVENSGDGVGADRRATFTMQLLNVTGAGPDRYGSGVAAFTQLVQDWIDGVYTDTRGLTFQTTNGHSTRYRYYYCSEDGTPANRPKLTIVYDLPTTTTTAPPTTTTTVPPTTTSTTLPPTTTTTLPPTTTSTEPIVTTTTTAPPTTTTTAGPTTTTTEGPCVPTICPGIRAFVTPPRIRVRVGAVHIRANVTPPLIRVRVPCHAVVCPGSTTSTTSTTGPTTTTTHPPSTTTSWTEPLDSTTTSTTEGQTTSLSTSTTAAGTTTLPPTSTTTTSTTAEPTTTTTEEPTTTTTDGGTTTTTDGGTTTTTEPPPQCPSIGYCEETCAAIYDVAASTCCGSETIIVTNQGGCVWSGTGLNCTAHITCQMGTWMLTETSVPPGDTCSYTKAATPTSCPNGVYTLETDNCEGDCDETVTVTIHT